MNRVTIQCIVEGHGEVEAVPALLRRLILRFCPDGFPITPMGIRQPRCSIVKTGELERWVEVAARAVRLQGGILVLLDADDDLPCELAPALLDRARTAARNCPVSVVLAKREYEAWFIASASAIAGQMGLPTVAPPMKNCEQVRGTKEWLTRWRAGADIYSPTLHQTNFTRLIDIDLARQNSPSFDKLCRDVERLCQQVVTRFNT